MYNLLITNTGYFFEKNNLFTFYLRLLYKDKKIQINISFCLVEKPELMDWIKNNKVSKALFLIQKALLEHDSEMMTDSNTTTNLLEVKSEL